MNWKSSLLINTRNSKVCGRPIDSIMKFVEKSGMSHFDWNLPAIFVEYSESLPTKNNSLKTQDFFDCAETLVKTKRSNCIPWSGKELHSVFILRNKFLTKS